MCFRSEHRLLFERCDTAQSSCAVSTISHCVDADVNVFMPYVCCDLLLSAGARRVRRVKSAKPARGPIRVTAAHNDGPDVEDGHERQHAAPVAVAGIAAGAFLSFDTS